MQYILTDANSNSEELYYFNSLEQIRKHIEETAGAPEEFSQIRIFKLEREIEINHLFGPQTYA